MSLAEWADLATIVGVIALPLSAAAIWIQLRQQTLLATAANTQALVELSSPFNLQLIQDPEMADLWVNGAKNYANFDSVKQYRFQSMLIWWLILHENIYVQKKNELLDPTVFSAWKYDLESFVRLQLGDLWPKLKPFFQAGFAAYVDDIIANSDDPRPE